MKKLLLFYLCFLVYGVTQVFAQNRTITGTVTGRSDGLPLPGVSISVKGTTQGTQSDANGNFSIAVGPDARTLVFSYIGYITQEVAIGATDKLRVGMDADSKALDEVVVTGYSTILKRDNVASISKISGDRIANLPVTSFDQALGGKAAGLQVNVESGIIGAPVVMRIRGVSSISSSSEPLVVIDGVPVPTADDGQLYNNANPLSDLNPNDIERIDVLKDPSATSLYGSRGANGVILVTTKQGVAGVTKVNLDTYFGFNEPNKQIKVLNGEQYNQVINQRRANAGLAPAALYGDYNGDGTPDPVSTDWQKLVYKKGMTMNHQLSVSGGDQKTVVYAGASYMDYQNYIDVNRQRKGSIRINVTNTANNWLKLGFNSQYSRNLQNGLGSGTGPSYSGIPFGPLMFYPNVPVKVDGAYYDGQGGNTVSLASIPNPVAVLYQNYDNQENKHFLGNGFAEATILPGLRLKTNYGVDYEDKFEYQYWGDDFGDGRGLGGLVQDVYTTTTTWNWSNTLSYNQTFGASTINALAGAEFNKYDNRYFYAAAYTASDPFYNQFVGSAFSNKDADGNLNANGFDSYFASVNYSYKGKYLAEATYRNDAYSGYGKNFRRGGFPSGSLAWNFTQEDFAKNLNWLSDGKLRLSYGVTGNSQIGDYPALAIYEPVQYATLGGSSLSSAGNQDLHWEKTKQFDAGLDFSLYKKLNIIIDYYDKRTSGLILNNPVPYTLGIPTNSITQNIGSLNNKGLEFTASSDIGLGKDLRWLPNFNISYNKNIVTSTPNGADITAGTNIARPGYALGSYYLVRWAGVNPQNGFSQFLDANGNVRMYDPAAKVWEDPATGAQVAAVGSGDRVLEDKSYFPKIQGGFGNTFVYKQFDLNVFLEFATDFWIYDDTQQALHNQSVTNNSADILNSWTTAGQITDNPKMYYNDATSLSAFTSTRWLEKGNYLRGKNIAVGYTLTKSAAAKLGVASIRIYAQVQNAFTITGYKGTNPETSYITGNVNGGYTNQQGNIEGGRDYFTPYLARTWTLGLNVGF
jgi:TonB-linked SusC/RagA family outer membrane protein